MPRVNTELERQRKFVEILQRQLDEIRKPPGDFPVQGCGDNSCEIRRPEGVGTNGGCRCSARDFKYAMQWWKRKAMFEAETIKGMREETKEMGKALDQSLEALQMIADYVGAKDYISSIGPIIDAIDEKIEKKLHSQCNKKNRIQWKRSVKSLNPMVR